MGNFKQAYKYVTEKAKELKACSSEYKKALESKTVEDLIIVIRDNAGWVNENDFIDDKDSIKFFNLSISNLLNSGNWNSGYSNSGNWNSGDSNSGYSNSGNWNSGYRNSGDRNSGDRNSGNWNSGNWNSGDSNSGNWNSGDSNSGYSNSGNWNSGYRNSGNWNSGYRNSGNWNSGYSNSGNWNSGNWNSGYSNSGFFNSKTPKYIKVFNKKYELSVWENVNKPNFIYKIITNKWISFRNMSEDEKVKYPKAFVCDGYLKTISYKDAWKTAYESATENDIKLLKALPNFNKKTFKEITGIKVK